MSDVQKLAAWPNIATGERPETGPMQFGDDWPGVFIRGDDAFAFAIHLGQAIRKLPADAWAPRAVLKGLYDTLRSSDVRVIRGEIPGTLESEQPANIRGEQTGKTTK